MRFFPAITMMFLALPISPSAAQDRRDGLALLAAFRAINQGEWDQAREAAERRSALLADIIEWRRLREAGGTLDETNRFLQKNGDWPGLQRLRRVGEQNLTPNVPADQVLAYFKDQPPQTGHGMLRKSIALRQTGQAQQADALIVQAWREQTLTKAEFATYLTQHTKLLTSHHEARIDMLLWRGRLVEAERLMPLINDDQKKLAAARMGLQRNISGVDDLIKAVPDDLRNAPGLAFDRFEWRVKRGFRDGALEILQQHSVSADMLGRPEEWANRRRLLARQDMRNGNAGRAYALAANHHLTAGSHFADLEWLAGYIALRKLNKPDVAIAHFERFSDAVGSPISKGRAGYWLGRAYEVAGNPTAAGRAYAEGAQYQTSFYGLLAAERLQLPMMPSLVHGLDAQDWRGADFVDSSVFQAAQLLLQSGHRDLAEMFLTHLAESLNAKGVAQLAKFAMDQGEPHLAVMIGKRATGHGVTVPAAMFPVHPLADENLTVPPELALAIARRESEFDPTVRSRVGARGLMQLMPATARAVASDLDLDYTTAKLSDPDFNATLGVAYLEDLTQMFGPSYVLVAAAYNAGPSRPRRWMTEHGDPRTGDIDPIDWIEHIEFRETRNYVMRVMESLPVYRAQLTGHPQPLRLTEELIGTYPVIRPRMRPDGDRTELVVPATE
ncbi:lytic transglycosylase domain-containing protein [Pseudaestuariivita rosea]|uniref:lytic transglycosylase domain-containing protein n=1 Tax=Pseudaestuariivita rosea TaxID=2763263 RepID=UPI001ABBB388|nr:lytic transglycosylase domain-containing protein [Pseudaestuariivita rosea]